MGIASLLHNTDAILQPAATYGLRKRRCLFSVYLSQLLATPHPLLACTWQRILDWLCSNTRTVVVPFIPSYVFICHSQLIVIHNSHTHRLIELPPPVTSDRMNTSEYLLLWFRIRTVEVFKKVLKPPSYCQKGAAWFPYFLHFLAICEVIACRLSPAQKAGIVELIRKDVPGMRWECWHVSYLKLAAVRHLCPCTL